MIRGHYGLSGHCRRVLVVGLLIGLLSSQVFVQASAQLLPSGQIPTSTPLPEKRSQPWWDFQRGRRCGRLFCSQVMFPVQILNPGNRLTLAYQAPQEISSSQAIRIIEQRAETVSEAVKDIRRHLTLAGMIAARPTQKHTDIGMNSVAFWWFRTPKSIYPLTPKVSVGRKNEAYVVYIEATPRFKIAQQILVTVTAPDARRAGLEVPDLAQKWAKTIRASLSETLWGLDFNRRYPGARIFLAFVLAMVGIVLLRFIAIERSILQDLNRRLKDMQASMSESERTKVMAAVAGAAELPPQDGHNLNPRRSDETEVFEQGSAAETSATLNNFETRRKSSVWSRILFKDVRKRLHSPGGIGLLSQFQNLIEMLLLFSNLLRISIILLIPILVSGIVPGTRIFSFVLLQQSIVIPLMWGVILILRVISVFTIDYRLNAWVKESCKQHPDSKRYSLRAQSYSRVLKGASALISVLLGVVLTLLLLGVDRSIFTSAGVIAVGVGLLSRNLLEDMLNGLMILANDRFAIGDVVSIANHGGLVEDMNIINTQLRGFDGQLTTLPNGLIKEVENLTKDWSRVNFEIEVSASENLRHVLNIIRNVGEEMHNDSNWKDHFLGNPEVLGVDQIHHYGCLIRVWIKTQPLDQWLVGREFRLRVKEAFDLEGIVLGIPRRLISSEGVEKKKLPRD